MARSTTNGFMPAMIGLALSAASISVPASAAIQTVDTPQDQLRSMVISAMLTFAGTYLEGPAVKGEPKMDTCEIVRDATRELMDAEAFGMRATLSPADRKKNADDMDSLWEDIASLSKQQNCGVYVPARWR